jgi:predicted ATPase/class 3 adenylate cyclase
MMAAVRSDLPGGTVTFLFTDVEGSTALLHALGAEGYAQALSEHRRVLRAAFAAGGGVEVDTQGDAFFYAFADPEAAVGVATAGQRALADGPVRVRMGLHTGKPLLTDEGYVGEDVHLGARIAAAGHGGQVLLSETTRRLVQLEAADLGLHQLKDFSSPVAVFQLGSERFPPLKTISNTNIPRPASSFVGRERELNDVVEMLRGGVRLLTLAGPGGSGKTRLAIEAATELVSDFKAGVYWVALASLSEAALVPEAIARALGTRGRPADEIGRKELLLVLDNLEHLAEAAPELADLVERCPNLRILLTSREVLRVRGEVAYAVPPLAESEAVELFCARAGLEPDEAIEELCRRLDNLPLAVELAAARTSVLSPGQMLTRLSQRLDLLRGGRDAAARQQTLRAAIEWSYELLTAEERRLFARLAVFAGCTLEAAEEVAGADLDLLQSLVDKNLLRHSDERFWMLETIREYAAERLEASGEAAELRERHAHYLFALAEEGEPHLVEYSEDWLDRLELEHDNLRAALDWFTAARERELVQRLAGALSRFWDQRAHLAEGRRRLEAALLLDDRPTAARAKALNGAADMAVSMGDAGAARAYAEEALALHAELGDARGTGASEFLLGLAFADLDDPTEARRLFDDGERRFRELGEEWYLLVTVRMLAWMCYRLGDRERGRELHEDNLLHARALGARQVEASTLEALAIIAVDDGRADAAAAYLRESHRVARDPRDRVGLARHLCRVARVLAVSGDAGTAAVLLACAEARLEEMDVASRPWLADMNARTREDLGSLLDEAALRNADEHGRGLDADRALELALEALG